MTPVKGKSITSAFIIVYFKDIGGYTVKEDNRPFYDIWTIDLLLWSSKLSAGIIEPLFTLYMLPGFKSVEFVGTHYACLFS